MDSRVAARAEVGTVNAAAEPRAARRRRAQDSMAWNELRKDGEAVRKALSWG